MGEGPVVVISPQRIRVCVISGGSILLVGHPRVQSRGRRLSLLLIIIRVRTLAEQLVEAILDGLERRVVQGKGEHGGSNFLDADCAPRGDGSNENGPGLPSLPSMIDIGVDRTGISAPRSAFSSKYLWHSRSSCTLVGPRRV